MSRDRDTPSIVWFRDDLRVADHPALHAAVERGGRSRASSCSTRRRPASARSAAPHAGGCTARLTALGDALEAIGGRLVLRRGPADRVIRSLVDETGAGAVFWNRRYGGPERELDAGLKQALHGDGLDRAQLAATCCSSPGRSARPGHAATRCSPRSGGRAARRPSRGIRCPHPSAIDPADAASDDLDAWELLPTHPDWADGLREAWTPGRGWRARAPAGLPRRGPAGDYAKGRDEPAEGGDLAPVAAPALGRAQPLRGVARGARAAVGRRGDRALPHRAGLAGVRVARAVPAPDLATRNWRAEFDAFPWPRLHPTALRAWEEGRTGVPLVDAGMRELWATGTMHNRVRMVTASFLTKNLLIDWRRGEEWFWDTLVDADAASNPFNWQWVAGSGADAAPYFRVFNPELQATKFDRRRRVRAPLGARGRHRRVPRADRGPQGDPRGGARRLRAGEGGPTLETLRR